MSRDMLYSWDDMHECNNIRYSGDDMHYPFNTCRSSLMYKELQGGQDPHRAVCCSVLQCVAVCCSVILYVAGLKEGDVLTAGVCCCVLRGVATQCI